MKKARILCALLMVLAVWTAASSGTAVLASSENRYAVAGIENAAEFEKAFLTLQAAVSANDRGKVVDFVLYPLRVNGWLGEATGKATVQFTTRQEVMGNFDDIFTTRVKEALVKQKVGDLFVNWQGVMVGKGEAWLSISDKTPVRYGIIAVNLETEMR